MRKLLFLILFVPWALIVHAQNRTVNGIVTDHLGDPLPGVSVVLKGSSTGAVTDVDGKFNISVPANGNAELKVSFLGMTTKTVPVGASSSFNIMMEEDAKQLDEIVVVGYGTAKKTDLTGSVTSIKADKLTLGSATNAAQMLTGRVAGLYVNSGDQNPGKTNDMFLRGVGSLAANTQPLVVVDGFPANDASILNTINPNDIEQIDVLKDASAAAIYGARGANGVIIVTTKMGASGKLKIDAGTKLSMQQIGRKIDLMNSDQYIRYWYDLAHDPSYSHNFGAGYKGNQYPYPLEAIGATANTDWQNELTRTAITQDYNISLYGGSDNFNFRVSANYYDGKGVVGPYEYDRFNLATRLNYKRDKLSFSTDLSYTMENTNNLKNNFSRAIQFAPTVGKYDADGNLAPFPISSMNWFYNPFYEGEKQDDHSENNTMRVSGSVSYEFIPGLKLEARAGLERKFSEDFQYKPVAPNSILDEGKINTSNRYNINTDLILTYNKKINKHSFGFMGGINDQRFRNRGAKIEGKGFASEIIRYYQMASIIDKNNITVSSYWDTREIFSLLGRANYNYDDRYLLTVNFRRDAATQFSPAYRWGNFPSAALAWRINNESFYKLDYIDNLKLKAGYGITGNADVPAGRTQSLIQYASTFLGGSPVNGIVWASSSSDADKDNETYAPNGNLRWEGAKTVNVGLEVGSKHFLIDLNAYRKDSYDLLMDRPLPVELGYQYITVNKGKLLNYGLEAKIDGYLNFMNNQIRWTPSLWGAYNRNELVSFGGATMPQMAVWYNQTNYGYGQQAIEGYPIGGFWGYEYAGVWQESEAAMAAMYGAVPGDPKFIDWKTTNADGTTSMGPDGVIDSSDKRYLGNQYPEFTAGFSNMVTYKNWSLSFMFDGVFNKKVLNFTRLLMVSPDWYRNLSTEAMNRWTPDRPNTDIPSATRRMDSRMALSTFCIEDASFVRLREVTLAYKMDFKNSNHIQGLQVYLTGSNLATFSGYRGVNPDVMGLSVETHNPISRTYILGMNFYF